DGILEDAEVEVQAGCPIPLADQHVPEREGILAAGDGDQHRLVLGEHVVLPDRLAHLVAEELEEIRGAERGVVASGLARARLPALATLHRGSAPLPPDITGRSSIVASSRTTWSAVTRSSPQITSTVSGRMSSSRRMSLTRRPPATATSRRGLRKMTFMRMPAMASSIPLFHSLVGTALHKRRVLECDDRTRHGDANGRTHAVTDRARLARTPWRRLTSRPVYENPWIRVREDQVELPDGRTTLYGVVQCAGCVGVLPFVDAHTVVLVGQYRYVAGGFYWEMPTGAVKTGESEEAAVQRELAEEAGYEADRLGKVCAYHTSKRGGDETATIYLAQRRRPVARSAGRS